MVQSDSMVHIDGSKGEGGGQIVRTSLALSMITGKPIHLENIRAGRKKPGLMRQHLTCVRAAADICGAEVSGAEMQASSFTFTPGPVKPGNYRFAVGTAGSTVLVAQTILPALMMGERPSTVTLEGGAHVMKAPSIDFFDRVFLPHIRAMGPSVDISLERRGFYPAGGGAWSMAINPVLNLRRLDLLKRGALEGLSVTGIVAQLAATIAAREIRAAEKTLSVPVDQSDIVVDQESVGPGNIVMVEARFERLTELFQALGEAGLRAELVGKKAANAANRYLNSLPAVGPYLADQLLLPMALGSGGRFTMLSPSLHTTTNAETVRTFLGTDISISEGGQGVWDVCVSP